MIDFTQTWWPPAADQCRLEGYERKEELFESEHAEAFEHKSAKVPSHLKDKLYLIQDYPKLISTTVANLLFGQAPVFSFPENQAQLNRLVTENRIPTTLYEAELSASFRGDAVFKLSIGPRNPGGENEVLIEEVPAYAYFAELDPDNARRVLSQCLAWERCVQDADGRQTRYLRVEHHEPGFIYNELYKIEGQTKVKGPIPLETIYDMSAPDAPKPVEETGVPFPLLFHFPNVRHGSIYYGMSDYSRGLETLFDEANQRITSIATVLDKHIDPKLVLPTGILNKRGNVKAEDLQVIEVAPEDAVTGAPRMLTWDAQLESSFRQLEIIEKKIFQFADISRIDREGVGNVDSGRAMHMLFAPMLALVTRKQNYRQPVICEMLYCAMWLGAARNVPGYTRPITKPEMVWRNSLPKDDQELTTVAAMAVGARIMSRETAIRYTLQVGADEAAAELARIDADNPEPAPPAPMAPPPGPPSQESSVA